MSKLPIIGITIGDVNGIGVEVMIKSLLDHRASEHCTPVVYGNPKIISYWKKLMGFPEFNMQIVKGLDQLHTKKSNIMVCWDDDVEIKPGEATDTAGKFAFKSFELAVNDLKEGKIQALVTAPLNKQKVNNELLPFKGHTGYLAQQAGTADYLMMMVSGELKVALVTEHVPIKEVSSKITTELVLKKIKLLNKSLRDDFSLQKPRIAVLGLNPHAGENGLLGNEEIEKIIPAIEAAKNENIMVMGPYSADGFFGARQHEKFDAVLAMYHDQGLIPFKYLAFDAGVNFTAGLPFVRTSPDHGTAYNIAGKNIANEESFRNALYLAIDIVRTRNSNYKLNENPLPFSPLRKERFRIDF